MQKPVSTQWRDSHCYLLLAALTLACLLPFSGRAFHIDDPLFVWAGQQIAKHPADPFGFQVLWDDYREPMSEVTKNPPLACYYVAAIGSIAGWGERALHLGFLLPALALVLGTYRLAQRFTSWPVLAAAATLLTPGVLVSACSIMCDTMMLAFWVWAASLWLEGLDREEPGRLALSGVLTGMAALTKYFGICLVPLLLVYSLVRRRRLGSWAWFLLLPLVLFVAYQSWTLAKYGHEMFSDAVKFAPNQREIAGQVSAVTNALIAVSFVGGCVVPVLLLAPFLWRWKRVAAVLLVTFLGGCVLALKWTSAVPHADALGPLLRAHWQVTGVQLGFAMAAGIGVLCLAGGELAKRKSADSILLGLWILGTFLFAGFLNWTINARSVLPLIPAVAIVLARRLDSIAWLPHLERKVALGLALSGVFSFWLAKADAEWANSAKQAASFVRQRTQGDNVNVWFQGHWGFQYYMQQFGAQPVDFHSSAMDRGDLLVIPDNNTDGDRMPSSRFVASTELLELPLRQPLSTMRWRTGAAFYASFYGPLPFSFGPVPTERYFLFRLSVPMARRLIRWKNTASKGAAFAK